MIHHVIDFLLSIYERMDKFESEKDLGVLKTIFYNAKKALYLTIKELLKDTEELKRLEKNIELNSIYNTKDYKKLLIYLKNKGAKEQLEQYIKYIEEFKQKWSQKQD